MKPVCALARFAEESSYHSGPIFLQRKGAQRPRSEFPNVPDPAAEIPFNMFAQLFSVFFRGPCTSNDVQYGKHCLGCRRMCSLV